MKKASFLVKIVLVMFVLMSLASCSSGRMSRCSAERISIAPGQAVWSLDQVQELPVLLSSEDIPAGGYTDPREELLSRLSVYIERRSPASIPSDGLQVEFIVEKDGTVSQVTVTPERYVPGRKSASEDAVRAVSQAVGATRWIPARENGSPARVLLRTELYKSPK